jgi:ubiquinone/menaquinone biosynthesis C-methylase UbiE
MSAENSITTEQSLKDQQVFYDSSWSGTLAAGKELRSNLKINMEFLSRVDLLKPGHKILEVGCGMGRMTWDLMQQGYDITGCDISNEAINYGLNKYEDINLQVQPAESLSYADNSFDMVLSFDLLEHIAEVDRHISEVTRVLKQGGFYLFQTPNKLSNIVFETITSRSLKWRRYHPSLHFPGQLRRRLKRHGLGCQFVVMDPMNEFTLNKLKALGLLGRIIQKINFTKLPLCLQTNLYVVACKCSREGKSV